MPVRTRFVAGAVLACATAMVTFALAQPRPRPGNPPPRRPTADAAAPPATAPTHDTSNPYAALDAGAPPAPVATTAAPEPAPPPELFDGGIKPSPLNPAPNEFPDGGPPPQTLDYDRLLADIAALRARVAAVSDSLFESKISVMLETSGDHGKIARLAVSLDEGIVFVAPASFRAEDMKEVYGHAVAPGRHAVTIEVERRDDREESFRTTQKSRFVVDVPLKNQLTLEVKVWDDSNMGGDFPADKSGRYDLRVRAKASAKPFAR